jgi:hypothetical protein
MFGCLQFELVQLFREATSPVLNPALHLRQHGRERERRKVETERLQDAGQNRLPTGAGPCLVGAARLAGFRRSTQRPFGFVVRGPDPLGFPVRLFHGLGRHEDEQLPGQHQPHDFVGQPTIIVIRPFERRQVRCPQGCTQLEDLVIQGGDVAVLSVRSVAA